MITGFTEITGMNFEDLVTEIYNLLTDRSWRVTRSGIEKNLDKWWNNKLPKIVEMCKHPMYNGNLQIIVPVGIKREVSASDAKNKLSFIKNSIYVNENSKLYNGKTAKQYLSEYVSNMSSKLDIDNIKENNMKDAMTFLNDKFNSSLESYDVLDLRDKMYKALDVIYYSLSMRISPELANDLNNILRLDKKKVVADQKTSKVVSRILHMGNYDAYNGAFTEFSDYVNENEQKGYYVISLNPLDYLRMSDGNSWSSCHTTDYKNTRGLNSTYHGQYCQGCLSYMNDFVSFVTYFIDTSADIKHPDRSWKIYRNMVHEKQDKTIIIQGRVYPQSNDGWKDIYNIFSGLFFDAMKYENYVKLGVAKDYCSFETHGANYQDYIHYRDCKAFEKKGNSGNRSIVIGEKAYSCNDGSVLGTYETNKIV